MADDKRTVADHVKAEEEDLSKGPTPESRRAEGEPPAEHDQTEGPTPRTREADRHS